MGVAYLLGMGSNTRVTFYFILSGHMFTSYVCIVLEYNTYINVQIYTQYIENIHLYGIYTSTRIRV